MAEVFEALPSEAISVKQARGILIVLYTWMLIPYGIKKLSLPGDFFLSHFAVGEQGEVWGTLEEGDDAVPA